VATPGRSRGSPGSGPGVPAGAVVATPVSLVDGYRSILEAVGCPLAAGDEALPSCSLWAIAAGQRPDRTVLSEYHAAGSITGSFMIRHGRWKYVHHVGFRPELYDLEADPFELNNLVGTEEGRRRLPELQAELAGLQRETGYRPEFTGYR